jgi:hypothetical protein
MKTAKPRLYTALEFFAQPDGSHKYRVRYIAAVHNDDAAAVLRACEPSGVCYITNLDAMADRCGPDHVDRYTMVSQVNIDKDGYFAVPADEHERWIRICCRPSWQDGEQYPPSWFRLRDPRAQRLANTIERVAARLANT